MEGSDKMFFTGCSFTFNGVDSKDFGLFIGNTETDMFHRQFGLNREIIEEDDTLSPIPFYFGTKTEPIEGKFTMFSTQPLTLKKLKQIEEWLFQDKYCEFSSNDEPDVFYNLMFIDSTELYLPPDNEGYFELNFRTDAPWAWSRFLEKSYDFSSGGIHKINIENVCQLKDYNPLEVEFQCVGYNTLTVKKLEFHSPVYGVEVDLTNQRGCFVVTNSLEKGDYILLDITEDLVNKLLNDPSINNVKGYQVEDVNGKTYKIECEVNAIPKIQKLYGYVTESKTIKLVKESEFPSNEISLSLRNIRNTSQKNALKVQTNEELGEVLQPNEIIYLNMGSKELKSSIESTTNRMDCVSGNWITLEKGNNTIEVIGNCYITFRCKYPIII